MKKANKFISLLAAVSVVASMFTAFAVTANADGTSTPTISLTETKTGTTKDSTLKLDITYSNSSEDALAQLETAVKFDNEYLAYKEAKDEVGEASLSTKDPSIFKIVFLALNEKGYIKTKNQLVTSVTFDVIKDIDKELTFSLSDTSLTLDFGTKGQVEYGLSGGNVITVNTCKVMPAAQLSISAENNILGKDESTKLNVTSKFFDPAPTFEESNFSVAGNTSKDTKVVKDGADFKLHIGADETASKVTVTVKSGDVTASVDVAVKGIVLTAADANVVKGGKTELKVTQNNVSETFTEANFTVEGNSSADTKVTAESGKYYLNVAADETASKITVKFAVSTYTASVEVGVADVVCNWTNSKFTVSAGNTATANLKVSGIPEGVKYTVKYVVTSGDEYASVSSSSSTSAKIKGIKAGSAIVTAYVYLGENTGKDYVAEADLLVTVTKKSSSGNNNSGSTSGGSIAGGTAGSGSTGVNISARPDLYNPQFADLNEASWAADAINSLAKKGILTGRTDTEFAPNASVTRAEFVKMVSTLYNLVTPTSKFATQSFKDVPKDAWFFNYVEVCAQLGIVNGEGDGYFNPNALISRQEMAAIMYRTATIMGTKLTATEAVKTFADANEISDYAKAAVSALQTAGIISGTSDTTFEPALACTRAQAAVIINNMYTKYAK